MFEKDAIRYAFENTIGIECLDKPVEDFSYEELSDELQEKAFDFKEGAEFGYNKANEWHRIDEGKYPSKEQLGESFIVAFAFNERTQKYYSFDCAEYVDKGKFCTHTNNDDKVIAWKEIVLPKESE